MRWMRPLGSTGIEVSAVGLGTVKLGRNQGLRLQKPFALPDDASARELLATARDLGINLLDTAPAYGVSEQRLGELLQGQRNDWVICSKAGEEFADGESHFDFSAQQITASVQRSLRRLRCDHIDVLLLHSNGDDLEILQRRGSLEALEQLRQDGLIRAFGISTKTVAGGVQAAARCDAVMLTYNLQQREEAAVLDACAANGTGALIKKALASGGFSGPEEADFVARSMQLVMNHPATSSVLVGTLSPQHLAQDCEAARAALG